MSIIDARLKFHGELEKHEVNNIVISNDGLPSSTIFDHHMNAIIAEKSGTDCHYFIESSGQIYQGLSEKYGNGDILILLGGFPIQADSEQLDALMILVRRLKKKYTSASIKLENHLQDNPALKEAHTVLSRRIKRKKRKD